MDVPGAIDTEALIRTHRDLVAINSVNPALETGGGGEQVIGRCVADFLHDRGVDVELQSVDGERCNVLGRLPGPEGAPVLMLEAHMDTASVGVMDGGPFSAAHHHGRIYGRGACDTKGCLAAMMHAMGAWARHGAPPVTLMLAAVCDEEHGQLGARRLAERARGVNGIVVGEPTENRPACAHKGAVRGEIAARGRAAHSSRPELGVNAISAMARLLVALDEELAPRLRERSHPLVGSPTINIGTIHGGDQVNFVPQSCTVTVDRRTIPGERSDAVKDELCELLERVSAACGGVQLEMVEPWEIFAAMDTPADDPLVRAAADACEQVTGAGKTIGVPYCTDASTLSLTGVPCVVLGPGSIDQAHSAEEWIEVSQLIDAATIYARMPEGFANAHQKTRAEK